MMVTIQLLGANPNRKEKFIVERPPYDLSCCSYPCRCEPLSAGSLVDGPRLWSWELSDSTLHWSDVDAALSGTSFEAVIRSRASEFSITGRTKSRSFFLKFSNSSLPCKESHQMIKPWKLWIILCVIVTACWEALIVFFNFEPRMVSLWRSRLYRPLCQPPPEHGVYRRLALGDYSFAALKYPYRASIYQISCSQSIKNVA